SSRASTSGSPGPPRACRRPSASWAWGSPCSRLARPSSPAASPSPTPPGASSRGSRRSGPSRAPPRRRVGHHGARPHRREGPGPAHERGRPRGGGRDRRREGAVPRARDARGGAGRERDGRDDAVIWRVPRLEPDLGPDLVRAWSPEIGASVVPDMLPPWSLTWCAAPNTRHPPDGSPGIQSRSIIRIAVSDRVLVHPVLLLPAHALPAGHLAGRPGPVEWAGERTVAEGLRPVALLARVPVVDDHLHRHERAPSSTPARGVVRARREPPVAALAVDRQCRRETVPRWRHARLSGGTSQHAQLARLVESGGLEPRIGHGLALAAHRVADL